MRGGIFLLRTVSQWQLLQLRTMPGKKPKSLYGIYRIDNEKYHAHSWRVSLRRYGNRYIRNFPDLKYGGKRQALSAAKLYRDSLIEKHPAMTRRDYANVLRVNNRSGVPGVYRYRKTFRLHNGVEKESWYWEASWPVDSKGRSKATFSVNQYGEEKARELAIEAREKAMRRVEGDFWAVGDYARQSPT